MVVHMFALRWKPEATAEHTMRALTQIQAFQGVVPGLLETVAGTNISPNGQDYGFGAMMRFADQKSLDEYQVSPRHKDLLIWLVPLVDAIDIDLVVDRPQ